MRKITVKDFHATYTGRGEFFTGIRTGERVLLRIEFQVYTDPSGDEATSMHSSIQSLRNPGAWLSTTYEPEKLIDREKAAEPRVVYFDPTPGYNTHKKECVISNADPTIAEKFRASYPEGVTTSPDA